MNTRPEHLKNFSPESGERGGQAESLAPQRELHSLRVETSEIKEGVEGLLGNEINEGNSEDRSSLGDYSQEGGHGQQTSSRQNLHERLLRSMPPAKAMVREIRAQFQKEFRSILKESRQAEETRDYHRMNLLMAKLRQLTEKIAELKEATVEQIKKIWLKLHGIISG